jgi:NAD(P)-dependent dehydrogenase (short-subunit alcohol dehydrogenase family)
MEGRLSGQAALVTGASSGLGRAAALELGREGAAVALLARDVASLQQVASDIDRLGVPALPVRADLADEESLIAATGQASSLPLTILVNAAGTDVPGPLADLSTADWDRVLAVNLRAPFILARASFPLMRAQGRGTIVNVSSVGGKRGWANAAPYCASKFGLAGLTQVLAAEGRPHHIRACLLVPGGMATGWGAWDAEQRRAPRAEPAPEAALAPREVARLISWICAAPPKVVLNEVIITPLEEQGWP